MEEKSPRRKQLGLKEYDYSQEGYYFITICTQSRLQILSEIICKRILFNKTIYTR